MKQPSPQPFGDAEALYAAAVGPEWKRYYRPRFLAFESGDRRPRWNWAAALVPFWASYRKLTITIPVALVFLVGTGVLSVELQDRMESRAALYIAYAGVVVVLSVLQGLFGTWLVYRKASGDIRRLRRTPGADVLAVLEKRAPRRTPAQDIVHGLTSLVLGTVGFFAVALPSSMNHAHDNMGRVYVQSDLQALVASQDSFRAQAGRFASLEELRYRPSTGDTVTLEEVRSDAYHARARWAGRVSWHCSVFVGSVRDTVIGAVEREPLCVRGRHH